MPQIIDKNGKPVPVSGTILLRYPFGSFIEAALAFDKQIVEAGCAPGSAAHTMISIAAGISLAKQRQFHSSLINDFWPKVMQSIEHGKVKP